MIEFIHSATIIVADQEAALDFYVGRLGWEKRIDQTMSDEYRFLTVAPPGAQTELVLGPAHVHGVEPGRAISQGRGMEGASGITFAVDDLDATYRTLLERGVRFSRPPEAMPWGGKGAWMQDPDGNSFFLVGS